jgi:hypothetical protein
VRVRYGASLVFFVSQLSFDQTDVVARASEAAFDEVRQAQANVAADDPISYLIVTDAFPLKNDNLHFNAAGQILLGEAFADSYVQSVPEPAPAFSALVLVVLRALAVASRRE